MSQKVVSEWNGLMKRREGGDQQERARREYVLDLIDVVCKVDRYFLCVYTCARLPYEFLGP
jgi:hypothetical protein